MFEVIEIQHHNTERVLMPPTAAQLPFECLFQITAIEQPGEWIAYRLIVQPRTKPKVR